MGSPPTDLKARTGELTPPGINSYDSKGTENIGDIEITNINGLTVCYGVFDKKGDRRYKLLRILTGEYILMETVFTKDATYISNRSKKYKSNSSK